MPYRFRLLLVLALTAAVAPVASGQDSGPLAAMMARGSNPNGPFAKRLSAADSLVARARDQIGKRYRFAAASPERGFDCSGLVKYVLGAFGVNLPHNAARIAREGAPVNADTSDLRPGDLLMFGKGRNSAISHVGIYVGDGRMVHASTSQHRVIETSLPAHGSSLRLKTVRRVLADSTIAHRGSE
jgi:cell wall-associated NlpC family hydrolase